LSSLNERRDQARSKKRPGASTSADKRLIEEAALTKALKPSLTNYMRKGEGNGGGA